MKDFRNILIQGFLQPNVKRKEESLLDRSVELQKLNSERNQFNEQIEAQTQNMIAAQAQIEKYDVQVQDLTKQLSDLESSNNQLRLEGEKNAGFSLLLHQRFVLYENIRLKILKVRNILSF